MKPRGLSKAFKKLRQKLHNHSSKNEKELDIDQPRPPLPSSTAGRPKAVQDELATNRCTTKPLEIDATDTTDAKDAEDAGIETSNSARHSSEDMKRARVRNNAERKVPTQPRAEESPSITHTSGDGSISYFNSACTTNHKTETPFTTPGYEWASRSRGYDWDTRRKIYGGNVLLGENHERTLRQRSEALERTYQKIEAEREQAIRVKPKEVRTMIASGYWAGLET